MRCVLPCTPLTDPVERIFSVTGQVESAQKYLLPDVSLAMLTILRETWDIPSRNSKTGSGAVRGLTTSWAIFRLWGSLLPKMVRPITCRGLGQLELRELRRR